MMHIMVRLVVVMVDLVLRLRLVGLLLIAVVLLRGLRTGVVTMTRVTVVIVPMTGRGIALLLIAIVLLFGGWCVVGSGIRVRMGRLMIPRLVFVLVGTLIACLRRRFVVRVGPFVVFVLVDVWVASSVAKARIAVLGSTGCIQRGMGYLRFNLEPLC